MSTLFEYFTGTLEEFLSLARDMDGNRLMKIQLTLSTLPEYQGYRHVLDNYTVKHILHRHSGKRERLRGQKPISLKDLQLISDIVLHADGITPVQCKNGNPGYIYTKCINEETFTLIEEVRNGHSELAVTTLYKRKIPEIAASSLIRGSSAASPQSQGSLAKILQIVLNTK